MPSIASDAAIRTAHTHLLAGRFAAALAVIAPQRNGSAGELLYALALAGSGEVQAAAPLLARIAAANPASRHPVLDLIPLVPPFAAPAHLRAAAPLRPLDPALPTALGTILAENGPMPAAVDAFAQATALAPGDAAAWSNLGKSLAAEARFDEADAAFATARGLAPADPRIAYNHATVLLKSGRFAAGWTALAARHALPGRPAPFRGPRLTDLDVAGQKILLRHDEGFGDTLQFIRYAEPLAARGARVVAAVPSALLRIVATAEGVAETIALTTTPRFDRWAPLLDVPALFGDEIPANVPYLRAESAAPTLPPGRRIGMVWAGDPRGLLDRQRSLPVATLEPLRSVPGICWFSLQKDAAPPAWMHDPMRAVRDFADTAAIVAQLDLVISVDTAVAHLAAALGKPVWLLDRYDACWRWLTGRTDSPWYPTLQIIRQSTPGDWPGVIASVVDRLSSERS